MYVSIKAHVMNNAREPCGLIVVYIDVTRQFWWLQLKVCLCTLRSLVSCSARVIAVLSAT